jgi:hypothetical protein
MNFKEYMVLFNFYGHMRNVSVKNNPTACSDGDLVTAIRAYGMKMPYRKDFLNSLEAPTTMGPTV